MAEGVKKGKRRLLIVLGIVLAVLVVLVFSLPYVLSTGAARGAILGAVNKRIAGKVHIQDLSLSWTGPSTVEGLKVTDPDGREVLGVKRASYAGGLWRAIASGQDFGQVEVDSPRVELYLDAKGLPSLVKAFESTQPSEPKEPSALPEPIGRLIVRNGSVRVVQPDGRAYEVVELNAQWDLATLNRVAGEVGLKAKTGGRLTATAEIHNLAPGGRIDPAQAAGKFTIATSEAIALGPLAKFGGARAGLAGSAGLNASGSFDRATGKGRFTLTAGKLQSAAAADNRQLRPIDLSLTGDLAATEKQVTATTKLTGEGAALRAEVVYHPSAQPLNVSIEEVLAAALGGGSVRLPDFTLDANGVVDLPRLGEAVPGLLNVLPNVRITGGKLQADKINVRGGTSPWVRGEVSLTGLAGQKGNQTVAADPVTLSVNAGLAPEKGLQFTRATFQSAFAQLTATGSQADLKCGFTADAAAVHKQLGELLDLSSLPRTGTATGSIELASRGESRVGQKLDATIKGVQYVSDGRVVKVADGLVHQEGDLMFTSPKRTKLAEAILTQATVELDGELAATASGNYRFADRAMAVDFELKQARLAGLLRRAEAWTKSPMPAVEGVVVCKGQVRRTPGGPLSVRVQEGRASQLLWPQAAPPTGKPAPAPAKALDLGFAANVRSDANAMAGDFDVTGQAVSLRGKFAYSPGKTPSLDVWKVLSVLLGGGEMALPDASADLAGRVDLGAVAAAAPGLLKTPPNFRIQAGLVELRTLALRGGKDALLNADLAVTNVAAVKDGNTVQFKPITLAVQAERTGQGPLRVAKAQLTSDAATVALSGEASKLSGTFSADLAAVRDLAAALADLGTTSFAGALSGTLHVETAVAGQQATIVCGGQASLAGASVDGKPVEARKIDLAWSGGRFATRGGPVGLASLKLTSPMATATVADFQADFAKALQLTGKFDVSADVGPCLAAAAPFAGWKEPPKLAGRLTAGGDFRSAPGGIASTANGKLAGLTVGAGKGTFRQQDVTFAYRGDLNHAKDSLLLDALKLQSPALTIQLAGKVEQLSTTRDLNLAGSYEGSWADLTALLHELDPSLKDTVSLAGTTGGKLSVTGPITRPKVTPTFRGLAAGAPVGWTKADILGLPLGEAKLLPQLDQGRIVLPETAIPASTGQVRLLGTVDLSQDPPVYSMTGRKMILQDVPITKTFSQEVLSRFNPVFAKVLSVEGAVSLRLEDLTLPLGKTITKSGSGGGHLDLQKLQIEPAGFLGTLLELGGLTGKKMLVSVNGADFAVRQGRIHYSNFQMTFAQSFALEFQGSVGFDDSVDLTVLVPVHPELLKKLGVRGPVAEYAKFLGDLKVPIPLLGTRLNPRLDLAKVDPKPLVERATKAMFEKGAGNILEDLLKGGKKDDKKPAEEGKKGAPKDKLNPLEDLLDLLGKPKPPQAPKDPNAPRRN